MISWSHALVTGGAGFIGSHLTRALLADGRRVTVLDNLSVGRREAVPEGARFVHGDIRDEAAVADALREVDCVFHLAAQVTIRGSFDRFHEDLDTNVMGTARLLRAVDRATGEVVHARLVDGGLRRCRVSRRRSTNRIRSGRSRRTALANWPRKMCRPGPRARGIPFTAVRFFNTYGPGPNLHAVCWRADDLHHPPAARRSDHDLR